MEEENNLMENIEFPNTTGTAVYLFLKNEGVFNQINNGNNYAAVNRQLSARVAQELNRIQEEMKTSVKYGQDGNLAVSTPELDNLLENIPNGEEIKLKVKENFLPFYHFKDLENYRKEQENKEPEAPSKEDLDEVEKKMDEVRSSYVDALNRLKGLYNEQMNDLNVKKTKIEDFLKNDAAREQEDRLQGPNGDEEEIDTSITEQLTKMVKELEETIRENEERENEKDKNIEEISETVDSSRKAKIINFPSSKNVNNKNIIEGTTLVKPNKIEDYFFDEEDPIDVIDGVAEEIPFEDKKENNKNDEPKKLELPEVSFGKGENDSSEKKEKPKANPEKDGNDNPENKEDPKVNPGKGENDNPEKKEEPKVNPEKGGKDNPDDPEKNNNRNSLFKQYMDMFKTTFKEIIDEHTRLAEQRKNEQEQGQYGNPEKSISEGMKDILSKTEDILHNNRVFALNGDFAHDIISISFIGGLGTTAALTYGAVRHTVKAIKGFSKNSKMSFKAAKGTAEKLKERSDAILEKRNIRRENEFRRKEDKTMYVLSQATSDVLSTSIEREKYLKYKAETNLNKTEAYFARQNLVEGSQQWNEYKKFEVSKQLYMNCIDKNKRHNVEHYLETNNGNNLKIVKGELRQLRQKNMCEKLVDELNVPYEEVHKFLNELDSSKKETLESIIARSPKEFSSLSDKTKEELEKLQVAPNEKDLKDNDLITIAGLMRTSDGSISFNGLEDGRIDGVSNIAMRYMSKMQGRKIDIDDKEKLGKAVNQLNRMARTLKRNTRILDYSYSMDATDLAMELCSQAETIDNELIKIQDLHDKTKNTKLPTWLEENKNYIPRRKELNKIAKQKIAALSKSGIIEYIEDEETGDAQAISRGRAVVTRELKEGLREAAEIGGFRAKAKNEEIRDESKNVDKSYYESPKDNKENEEKDIDFEPINSSKKEPNPKIKFDVKSKKTDEREQIPEIRLDVNSKKTTKEEQIPEIRLDIPSKKATKDEPIPEIKLDIPRKKATKDEPIPEIKLDIPRKKSTKNEQIPEIRLDIDDHKHSNQKNKSNDETLIIDYEPLDKEDPKQNDDEER